VEGVFVTATKMFVGQPKVHDNELMWLKEQH
jgi:hypothetical protein